MVGQCTISAPVRRASAPQVEILRMLRMLGKGHAETSDQMNDILAQVALASSLASPRPRES